MSCRCVIVTMFMLYTLVCKLQTQFFGRYYARMEYASSCIVHTHSLVRARVYAGEGYGKLCILAFLLMISTTDIGYMFYFYSKTEYRVRYCAHITMQLT